MRIAIKVIGGRNEIIEDASFSTVGGAREYLNIGSDYAASVEGEPQSDDFGLRDGDFVTFSLKVDGGRS